MPKRITMKQRDEALAVLEAYGRQKFSQPETASKGHCIGQAVGPALSGPEVHDAVSEMLQDANFHLADAALTAILKTPRLVKRKGRRLTITLPEHWDNFNG